jgi:ATP-dependent RNA helicase DHX29
LTPSVSGLVTPEGRSADTILPFQAGGIANVDESRFNPASDESDNDIEPEELLARYLKVKTQLYEIQPDLFDPKTAGIRPNTPEKLSGTGLGVHKVAKLRRFLTKLESDVLFDRDEAARQWKAHMRTLAQMGVARKGKPKAAVPAIPATSQSDDHHGDPAFNLPETSENQDEPDDLFGAIFTDEEGDAAASGVNAGIEKNTTTILRDFGKWTGISPRRVLEDACKAR